jgi:hypothetical protein
LAERCRGCQSPSHVEHHQQQVRLITRHPPYGGCHSSNKRSAITYTIHLTRQIETFLTIAHTPHLGTPPRTSLTRCTSASRAHSHQRLPTDPSHASDRSRQGETKNATSIPHPCAKGIQACSAVEVVKTRKRQDGSVDALYNVHWEKPPPKSGYNVKRK